MRPQLKTTSLRSGYGRDDVLRNVSLDVASGEVVGLYGPNGCGKSTLLDVIGGYHGIRTGSIFLGQYDITNQSPHRIARHGVGRLFQARRLFGHLRLEQCLLLLESQSRSVACTAIRDFEMQDMVKSPIGILSYGVQRLAGLAVALGVGRQLVLLDEPFASVHESYWPRVVSAIRSASVRGVSALIVDHRQGPLLQVADRILEMRNGEIRAVT
jgi:ABC-type branched-subunit amino acid transport system ATPase component